MNRLYEEGDVIYSEAHAKELLNIQSNYNKRLQELNNVLAKQKSDCNVKYMKIAQQQSAAQRTADKAKVTPQQNTNTTKQTGNVDTAGNPTNASGNPKAPTVESYPDILNIKELNEVDEPWLLRPGGEEVRYTGNINADKRDSTNWTERPVTGGHKEPEKKERRKKDMNWKIRSQIMDIEGEIADEEQNMKYYTEAIQSPEGSVEGEVEDFFAQIGPEASDILNSGAYAKKEEILRALQKAGIADAESILQDYYYYYPEFNPALDKKRKEAEKEIPKIQKKIDKLQAKIDKINSMYEGLNENSFLIKNVDPYELQDLKDYLDAENISYSEDEGGETIDFDETELDQEWRDRMDGMGFEDNNPEPETDDILSMDDDDEEDFSDADEKIDEEKVFYVKVDDEAEEFIGKIYKLFDEGDWRSKLVDGESDTFEKLNYDPDWDEVDIIAFLRENYADAELMSEEEYNSHIEDPEAAPEESDEEEIEESLTEDTKLEPNLGGKIDMKTHKILKKNQNKNDDELKDYEKEVTEHSIPTFDQYLNELKFSDGMEFDTSGELHTEQRSDGWYVVGKNMLIPVKSEKEGKEYIKKLDKK